MRAGARYSKQARVRAAERTATPTHRQPSKRIAAGQTKARNLAHAPLLIGLGLRYERLPSERIEGFPLQGNAPYNLALCVTLVSMGELLGRHEAVVRRLRKLGSPHSQLI